MSVRLGRAPRSSWDTSRIALAFTSVSRFDHGAHDATGPPVCERPDPAPPARPPALPLGALLALASTAALILVTELLPVGLLAPMGAALHQSEGRIGFLASGYAAAATVGAIPLTRADPVTAPPAAADRAAGRFRGGQRGDRAVRVVRADRRDPGRRRPAGRPGLVDAGRLRRPDRGRGPARPGHRDRLVRHHRGAGRRRAGRDPAGPLDRLAADLRGPGHGRRGPGRLGPLAGAGPARASAAGRRLAHSAACCAGPGRGPCWP